LQAYHRTTQFVPLFCCIYSSKFNTSESNQIEKKRPNLLVFGTKKWKKSAKSYAIRLQNDAVRRAKSYKQPCEMPQKTR
jgi:hypothetical protein